MTTDERLAAIQRRTTQLRAQEARRRARLLDGLCLALRWWSALVLGCPSGTLA